MLNCVCLIVFPQYNADPTVPSLAGTSPLHMAARYGHADIVQAMLKVRVCVCVCVCEWHASVKWSLVRMGSGVFGFETAMLLECVLV